MDSEGIEARRKRMKPSMEEEEMEVGDRTGLEIVEKEGTETNIVGSKEVESTTNILDKIEHFTQMVSELLESGKTMFKELSNEFEDRAVDYVSDKFGTWIHKEQMEKWQEEIKELRLLDVSNEEESAILHNARGSAAGALSDDMAVSATLLLPIGPVTESGLLSAASAAVGGDAAVGDKDSDGDTAGARELWRGA
ncbi:hypothetical protein EZV62_019181 [Acer yangbiense]|uniref:Uncharacterized protein n=1 Tax=Acer yangbiense TaxID=1000413 RepID=A0A5C7HBK9_9ROSI|nr:hypothetical protein EZV62_019181 [Acer yangbiense]